MENERKSHTKLVSAMSAHVILFQGHRISGSRDQEKKFGFY